MFEIQSIRKWNLFNPQYPTKLQERHLYHNISQHNHDSITAMFLG